MMIMKPKPSDYDLDERNETNTLEDSGLVKINVAGVIIAFGFYSTWHFESNQPQLQMLAHEAEGWRVIGQMPPLWDDPNDGVEFDMEMKEYAFQVEEIFTPLLAAYLSDKGDGTVDSRFWVRFRKVLEGINFTDDKLNIPVV